jgi:hypothetical protein
MTSRSSIVKKTSTLLDEAIHIMPKCALHLHGHQNKMVALLKPFIFAGFSNGIRFHSYTCWLTNDTRNHHLSCWVNNHHIDNENLVLSGHVKIGS